MLALCQAFYHKWWGHRLCLFVCVYMHTVARELFVPMRLFGDTDKVSRSLSQCFGLILLSLQLILLVLIFVIYQIHSFYTDKKRKNTRYIKQTWTKWTLTALPVIFDISDGAKWPSSQQAALSRCCPGRSTAGCPWAASKKQVPVSFGEGKSTMLVRGIICLASVWARLFISNSKAINCVCVPQVFRSQGEKRPAGLLSYPVMAAWLLHQRKCPWRPGVWSQCGDAAAEDNHVKSLNMF